MSSHEALIEMPARDVPDARPLALVVDESVDVRYLLLTCLRREGYHAVAAQDMVEAHAYAATGAPVSLLVISTAFSGYEEVIGMLHDGLVSSETAVILLRHQGSRIPSDRLLRLPRLAVLPKPFTFMEWKEALGRVFPLSLKS